MGTLFIGLIFLIGLPFVLLKGVLEDEREDKWDHLIPKIKERDYFTTQYGVQIWH